MISSFFLFSTGRGYYLLFTSCFVLLCAVLLQQGEDASERKAGRGAPMMLLPPSMTEPPPPPTTTTTTSSSHDLPVEAELILTIVNGPDNRMADHPAITAGLKGPSSEEEATTWSHAQLHADAGHAAAILRRYAPPRPPTPPPSMADGRGGSRSSRNRSCSVARQAPACSAPPPVRVLLAIGHATGYRGLAALLACLKNGYSYVNTAAIESHPDYDDIVHQIRPSLIIVDSATYGRSEAVRSLVWNASAGVLAMDEGVPGVPFLFEDDDHNTSTSTGEVRRMEPPPYTVETFPLDAEALIAFTSGSTGFPKMVASSFRQMLRVASKARKILGHGPESVLLSLSGYEDTAGYEMLYLTTLLYGCHVVPVVHDGYAMTEITTQIDEKIYLSALDRGVTMLLATPTMVSFLSDFLLEAPTSAPIHHNVQTIATFGSKLSAAIRRKAAKAFAQPPGPEGDRNQDPNLATATRFVEIYGATEVKIVGSKEAALDALVVGREDDDEDDNASGFLLADGVEARIVWNESLAEATRSEAPAGEIYIRSDTYMMGYVDQNMASPADEEGWFRMGDVGYLSEDGRRLTLTGRTRETINYMGEEVDQRDILKVWEGLLPDVEEMHVLPDDHSGVGGQNAVIFALAGRNFEFDAAFDAVMKAYEKYDVATDFYRSELVGTVQVVCFIDSFPRVGRDKANLKQVSRAYNKLVTERNFDAADTFNPQKWYTVFHLSWRADKEEFSVIEWEDDEF